MSGICSSKPAITSLEQLNTPFTPSTDSVLTLAATGARDEDGQLKESTLAAIYNDLARSGRLMSLQTYKEKLSLFGDKNSSRDALKIELENIGKVETNTMRVIGDEFCFYYTRYKFALEDLFNSLVQTSTATTELSKAQKDTIQAKLTTARDFNRKLNDIIQITNYIAIARSDETRDQNSEINKLNDSIKEMYGKLKGANEMLKREDATTNIKRRMVEFTQEKNLSANSLLSLYGFLNLVALGLLFYISRS